MVKANIANGITFVRIVCSIALLFCAAFSLPFYTLYILCGLTDMIDGFAARKMNTASDFGAGLDTVADFVFAVICTVKLFPVLDIPLWLYGWIAGIVLIKAINVISGFAIQKRFVALHTVMNKVTGALLFVWPLTLSVIDLRYSAAVVCAAATFAAVQEGHFIRTKREK